MEVGQELKWVPHPEAVWLPGRPVAPGSDAYATDLGEVRPTSKDPAPEDVGDLRVLEGVDDVCSLGSIADGSLLHTVRLRFARDDVYTNIARVLIAVNPFKSLPIYSSEHVERYRSAADAAQLPPHVFGVASDACVRLSDDRTSQALLISGESGAGKSETTKLALLYISEALSSTSAGFEDRILELAPALEAFGNAKTVRNSNSSRFGKWIEVQVDISAMRLASGTVSDYLLEVTRICSQGPGERNYHIFYQLMAGAATLDAGFRLDGGAEAFSYLSGNPASAAGIDDREDFVQLRTALASLGITPEAEQELFRIVAAILHLGNVQFSAGAEGADIAAGSEASVETAAQLLGCPMDDLSRAMRFKRLVVGADVTSSPLDPEKAAQARDSMSRLVYSRLFKWLVRRCNQALGEGLAQDKAPGYSGTLAFIGVLDIAGFESFETNMLEQLFINFSNEKLQQFFNATVFKAELADYSAEGIDAGKDVNFADNADVIALIEGKGGLLPMLDDATTGVRQTDGTFTTAAAKAHEKHPHFVKSKFPNQLLLGIRHFAGDVMYSTERFLEKNFSSQPAEVIELLQGSACSVVRELSVDPDAALSSAAPAVAKGPAPRGGAKKSTVSAAFRKSLQQLMDKLSTAQAHFIRCVKPNKAKVRDSFDSRMVMDQLRLFGSLEAVKIRRAGFPHRMAHTDFISRYLILLPRPQHREMMAAGPQASARTLLSSIVEKLGLEKEGAIGKSKVFLRDGLHRALETRRRLAFDGPANKLQAFYRGWRARQALRELREVSSAIKSVLIDAGALDPESLTHPGVSFTDRRRATVVVSALDQLDMLLERAGELPVRLNLRHARAVRARMAAETNLVQQMRELVSSQDVPAIAAALARSEHYHMTGEVVVKLRDRCEALQAQMVHRQALQGCLVKKDAAEVRRVVDAARAARLDDEHAWLLERGFDIFKEALATLSSLDRAEKEKREAQQKVAFGEVVRQAAELAQKKFEAAEAERRAMEAERRAELRAQAWVPIRERMEIAASEFDVGDLEDSLREAAALDVPMSQYAEAHQLFLDLQSPPFVLARLAELNARVDALDRKAEDRHEASSDDSDDDDDEGVDLLACCNLSEQLEVLGVKVRSFSEDQRKLEEDMKKQQLKTRKTLASIFGTKDPAQLKVAERFYESLAHFGKLRADVAGGTHGHGSCLTGGPGAPGMRGRSVRPSLAHMGMGRTLTIGKTLSMGKTLSVSSASCGPPPMLRHTPNRIAESLTQLDPVHELAALQVFGDILRCMGDKPSASQHMGADREQPILDMLKKHSQLNDEIYVQVLRQLTANPSAESTTRGWRLLNRLCSEVRPSDLLLEFVRAFLLRAVRGGSPLHEPGRKYRDMSGIPELHREISSGLEAGAPAPTPEGTSIQRMAVDSLELLDGLALKPGSGGVQGLG